MLNEDRDIYSSRNKPDVRDYKYIHYYKYIHSNEHTWSWEEYLSPTEYQGITGCCTAEAVTSLIEFYLNFGPGFVPVSQKAQLSEGYLYGNRRISKKYTHGYNIRDALATAQKYGVVGKAVFPQCYEVPNIIETFEKFEDDPKNDIYERVRIDKYYAVDKKDLKEYLYGYSPVVASIDMYDGTLKLRDNILQKGDHVTGTHAILIYGYDDRGWLALNSWGGWYGNRGKFVIPYDFDMHNIMSGYIEGLDLVATGFSHPFYKQSIIGKIVNVFYDILNDVVTICIKAKDLFRKGEKNE